MSSTPRSQDGVKAQTVFEAQAQAFSSSPEAEVFAQRAFDLQASAHPLNSERDQNFCLRAEDGSEWVLKIANPAENPARLDVKTQVPDTKPEALSVARARCICVIEDGGS